MSVSVVENRSWVCSCCSFPCTKSLEDISPELFNLLEKAIAFDAHIFFTLCCDYNSNGFCTAAQFFRHTEKIRTPLTEEQIQLLKTAFTRTWIILNNNSKRQEEPSQMLPPIKKSICCKCTLCGSNLLLELSESELASNAINNDPFPVILSHQTKKGEKCSALLYISKYGEVRSIEPITSIIQI